MTAHFRLSAYLPPSVTCVSWVWKEDNGIWSHDRSGIWQGGLVEYQRVRTK